MKILWVCPFFLHPTNRGAQIRTLGTLKELHKRHEVHFAALHNPSDIEGPQRSSEYSTRHFSVEHTTPNRRSLTIIPQLVKSIISPVPMAVFRFASKGLKGQIEALIASGHYDCIVCDFLAAAPNLPNLGECVLFQHNVETTIWKRHVEHTNSLLKRAFFQVQANRMEAYECDVCQRAKYVIAVSEIDVSRMKRMFEIDSVTCVPTGVDVEYFAPRHQFPTVSDIVFCGSMDWLPNVDAVEYFLWEVLPRIREQVPNATLTIAGRSPDARVLKAVQGIPGVLVTGSVEDMRPYLWGSKISVVPIRIGGGTRLKIYECMAAGVPVVSTTIGAEGLSYQDGTDILLADHAHSFAAACIRLLTDDIARGSLATNALQRARTKLSWEAVSLEFEAILQRNRLHTV